MHKLWNQTSNYEDTEEKEGTELQKVIENDFSKDFKSTSPPERGWTTIWKVSSVMTGGRKAPNPL